MRRAFIFFVFSVIVMLPGIHCLAVTPVELKEMLDNNEKVTVIDIRSTPSYTEGHIPGAINVPCSVIGRKRIPAIGAVVVCGDGIRTDLTLEAANKLRSRSGLRVDVLEGGFAAWETLKFQSTRQSGLRRRVINYLTYQDLVKAAEGNSDIVLVDLREKDPQGQESADPSNQGLVDIYRKFPGHKVIRPVQGSPGQRSTEIASEILKQGKGSHHLYLYVMIDQVDGQGARIAGCLMDAGVRRVAVLVGGERTLKREGRSELKKTERKMELE